MNCLTCELTRARIRAELMTALGRSFEDIAAQLSESYGERYIVRVAYGEGETVCTIERFNKMPPYLNHVILTRVYKNERER